VLQRDISAFFYIATVARVDTPYMEKSGNLIMTGEWPLCWTPDMLRAYFQSHLLVLEAQGLGLGLSLVARPFPGQMPLPGLELSSS